MSHLKYTALTPELYAYLLEVSNQESVALQSIREKNDAHPQIQMQIAPDQAQFLQFLIRSIHAKKVLEIGTFLGYSSAAMAQALPKDGQVITLDKDEKATEIAQKHWKTLGLFNQIQLILGPALDSMQSLINKHHTFDFIFIDADKSNYFEYYQLSKKLLAANGIIAIDNVFYHGEVCQINPSKNAKTIDKFNRQIHADPEMYISMLPIADGLTLAKKK